MSSFFSSSSSGRVDATVDGVSATIFLPKKECNVGVLSGLFTLGLAMMMMLYHYICGCDGGILLDAFLMFLCFGASNRSSSLYLGDTRRG